MAKIAYNVLWCSSSQGKVSYRANPDGTPVDYTEEEVDLLQKAYTIPQAFYILTDRDGTMVALDKSLTRELLG